MTSAKHRRRALQHAIEIKHQKNRNNGEKSMEAKHEKAGEIEKHHQLKKAAAKKQPAIQWRKRQRQPAKPA